MNDLEVLEIKKKIDEEIKKLPQCQHGWGPEAKDFNAIKDTVLAYIAYKLWEKQGKPMYHEVDFWLEAEEIWNFVRYMW